MILLDFAEILLEADWANNYITGLMNKADRTRT